MDASPSRRASSRGMAALVLLVVCALLSPAVHTHSLFGVGIGIDHGVTSKPCPACVSESNPGLTPNAPSVVPTPEVLAAVEIPAIAEVATAVASATGRSPPCA